jgi:hypothetical protein
VEPNIEVKLIAHQLGADSIHILLRLLEREPQHASEEGKGIRLDDFEDSRFSHATDFLEPAILRPPTDRALLRVSLKERERKRA